MVFGDVCLTGCEQQSEGDPYVCAGQSAWIEEQCSINDRDCRVGYVRCGNILVKNQKITKKYIDNLGKSYVVKQFARCHFLKTSKTLLRYFKKISSQIVQGGQRFAC